MSQSQSVLLFLCLLLLTPLWVQLYRWWRKRWRPTPAVIPADWDRHLRRLSPLYRRTPAELRLQVVRLALEFVAHKRFVGCDGLQIEPSMQQLIAYQACLLIVRRGLDCYADLASVLLYPGAFVVEQQHVDAAGVVTARQDVLSGQAIDVMRIVLSWPDVLAAGGADDGYNVVIHEFAHHLDHALDGRLSAPGSGDRRHELLEREYQALCDAVDAGEATLLDPYGSEDPAEFFAVATELFIELPRELRARHPQLYQSLQAIYRLDPASW
jgi:hypothetical protein